MNANGLAILAINLAIALNGRPAFDAVDLTRRVFGAVVVTRSAR